MSTTINPTLSGSKKAAAIINAVVSGLSIAMSLPGLALGSDAVASSPDQPPYYILLSGVILGVLGLMGSFGIWRGERWGSILTIAVRGLDGLTALPGLLYAPNEFLRVLAILAVVVAVAVIYLLLRRDTNVSRSVPG